MATYSETVDSGQICGTFTFNDSTYAFIWTATDGNSNYFSNNKLLRQVATIVAPITINTQLRYYSPKTVIAASTIYFWGFSDEDDPEGTGERVECEVVFTLSCLSGAGYSVYLWIAPSKDYTYFRSIGGVTISCAMEPYLYYAHALATIPSGDFYDGTAYIPDYNGTTGGIQYKEIGDKFTFPTSYGNYTDSSLRLKFGTAILPYLEAVGAAVTDGRVLDHWIGGDETVVTESTTVDDSTNVWCACWAVAQAKTQNLFWNGEVPSAINYNGEAVHEVYCNGVLVWED